MTLELLAPVIAIAVLGAAALALALQRGGQRRLVGRVIVIDVDFASPRQWPSILYFTGENCTICHTAQRPALNALEERLNAVPILEIDVAEQPEIARRFRVLSLPTTIVLGADGAISDINVGFASTDKLARQLDAAGARSRELVTA